MHYSMTDLISSLVEKLCLVNKKEKAKRNKNLLTIISKYKNIYKYPFELSFTFSCSKNLV